MSTPERPARAPRQATVAYLWVSTWTCAPWPLRLTLMADGGARHRASGASVDAAVFSTAVPLSSPTRRVRVRRSRLPRTDADSAARARARRRRPPAADPGADCPAALEASELRATRYIRGLRTTIIWGTMGVRHGAHTDTRATSASNGQRNCFRALRFGKD